jgi:polyhydroxyalkanoate synthesis regulator phasin
MVEEIGPQMQPEIVRLSMEIAKLDKQIKDYTDMINNYKSQIHETESKIDDLKEQIASRSKELQAMINQFVKPSGKITYHLSSKKMHYTIFKNEVYKIDAVPIYKEVLDYIYSLRCVKSSNIKDFLVQSGYGHNTARTYATIYVKYLKNHANPCWIIDDNNTRVLLNPIHINTKFDLTNISGLSKSYLEKRLIKES